MHFRIKASTSTYARWVEVKWGGNFKVRYESVTGKEYKKQRWLKAHICCGVKTNIVTAVEITDATGGDSPQFAPLVETTSQNFVMNEVSADKAYSSRANLKLVASKAATPYIDFKEGSKPNLKDSVWTRFYHFYAYNKEWFKQHYHKRSNVETTFSMIKAKFGGSLRSKTHQAQTNELLCKVLCHNLCCVIQSMYELGIDVDFGAPVE